MIQSAQIFDSKRKRRKRTDDQGRNHTCFCGKSYLSYPALYTHIKTKHPNQQLPKISRVFDNDDSFNINRIEKTHSRDKQRQKERQRQREKQRQRQKQKQKQKQAEELYPLYGINLPQVNNIQALRQLLFKYFPQFPHRTTLPIRTVITNAQKQQLRDMKQYWKQNRRKQDEKFEDYYVTPLNFVLGKFLIQLEADPASYCFKRHAAIFIVMLKRAIDKIKGEEYFRHKNAHELPLLFDEILKDYLIVDWNDFIANPTIAAKTLYYLGRWLYLNKFTNFSLKYNF